MRYTCTYVCAAVVIRVALFEADNERLAFCESTIYFSTPLVGCSIDARNSHCHYYRAMHFSAKRGIAIACRLSVRPSVCDVGEL